MATVTGRYNRYGYVIEVDGEEVYRAGNNPLESSEALEPSRHIGKTVPLETLAEYCRQTAGEIAEEERGVIGEIRHYLGADKL